MLSSMTGYGRAQARTGSRTLVVEVRSVNHRHADISPHLPRELWPLEDAIRQLALAHVRRGRVDIHLTCAEAEESSQRSVSVNRDLLSAAIVLLKEVCQSAPIDFEPPSLGDLLALPGLFTPSETAFADFPEADVLALVASALDGMSAMRGREGARLQAHLGGLCDRLEEVRFRLSALAPELSAAYRDRLDRRLSSVIADADVTAERLTLEWALWADRTSVEEEIERVGSHLEQFRGLMAREGEGVGRRLEFLVQEMQREIQTVGAKWTDLSVSECVLAGKHTLEQMREQLQNVE